MGMRVVRYEHELADAIDHAVELRGEAVLSPTDAEFASRALRRTPRIVSALPEIARRYPMQGWATGDDRLEACKASYRG